MVGPNQTIPNRNCTWAFYIASEIAPAHDGTLTATSKPSETKFVFRMPIAPRP
jgi:nitrogen-specific signal transduction histidine kinase